MAAVAEAAPRAAADPARPAYHFLPPAQWMNDLHGAFHHRGWYHVFFQFLPWTDDITEAKAGGVGWGHARSRDLVRWQFLPPALLPRPEDNARSLASGSSWIRADGVPMLFYTHTPAGFPEQKREPRGALPVDEELLTWRTVDLGLTPGNSGVPADIPSIWADIYLFGHGDRVFATFKQSDGLVCEAQNEELTEWRSAGHLGGTASNRRRRRSAEWLRKTSALWYLPKDIEIVAGDVADEADVRRCIAGLQRPLKARSTWPVPWTTACWPTSPRCG